ncbi:endonuclease Q family protein [Candidatus Parcubacteria bacterium]|nr:endonuclease Q family protein [Candidatus Parcubacteria bacterium]
MHSKYSRATSSRMNLEEMDRVALQKGVQVLSCADFTHPKWFKELKEKLALKEEGLFVLKRGSFGARFILTTEISCIYSKNNKVRKIHLLVFAPSFKAVEKINQALSKIGNLSADGRPILGLDAKELLKIALNISEDCLVVPAHLMTPWFSLFGSKSGFDKIEDCFEDLTSHIFALETGLSSDPAMNRKLSALDKFALISNSDAHSPEKIGREANVFETDFSYQGIVSALKANTKEKFPLTLEFFPEEGKYHFDGHSACGVVFSPEQTKKNQGLCPACQKPLVIGVSYRVNALSDRKEPLLLKDKPSFKHLIPLRELISEILGVGPASKKVEQFYQEMLQKLGPELNILMDLPIEEIKKGAGSLMATAIERMRHGKVFIQEGYDGVYGVIRVFSQVERKNLLKRQPELF